MRVATIVLAHDKQEQLRRLLRALEHPQVSVYLHLDSRAAAFDADPSATWLQRRRAFWGGPELVDVAADGLRQAVADGCEYFLLLSGADFPLRPAPAIVEFCEENRETSFVSHWPISDSRHAFGGRDRTDFYAYTIRGRRELCIPFGTPTPMLGPKGWALNWMLRAKSLPKGPRRFPSYVRPYGGRQWWNLSRAAATHILDFMDAHADYRRYHEHTWSPDEIFFNSILGSSDLPLVNNDLRYMRWAKDGMHAATLTAGDLPEMLESAALFARKFDQAVDAVALDRLEELLLPGVRNQRA